MQSTNRLPRRPLFVLVTGHRLPWIGHRLDARPRKRRMSRMRLILPLVHEASIVSRRRSQESRMQGVWCAAVAANQTPGRAHPR
jgi:hypothetical protein